MIETGILGFIMVFVGIIAIIQVVCFAFLAWYVLNFKTTIKLGAEFMSMVDDIVKEHYNEISKQWKVYLKEDYKKSVGSDE